MSEPEEQLSEKFLAIKEDLQTWGSQVDGTIMQILKQFKTDNKIKIEPRFRVKEEWSFISKCLYRGKNYANPLIDVEDKIGTRVVLLKSSDVYEAAQLLLGYQDWNIKTTKNLKELIEDKPKEFDYQSVHLVAHPINQENFKTDPKQLTCEIQLRTLLQHAFAEISHDSTYKGPYKNDKAIIRHLSKSIALMEVTDDYFLDIFEMISDEKRKYSNFYNELIKLYIKFNPSFDIAKKDIELVDLIFKLLSILDVPFNKIEEFTIKQKELLQSAVNNSKLYLFSQPVILLIAYYLFNQQSFLKNNWPLSSDILKTTFNDFGVSFQDY